MNNKTGCYELESSNYYIVSMKGIKG